MKALSRLAILAVLFAFAPIPCAAMRSIGILSPVEAKTMGLEVRATASGPDAAWVELNFKIASKLKDYNPEFSHVELELREGEKSMLSYVALRETHPEPGVVHVRFMANRAFISKLVLTIVVGDGARVGGAYELQLKEFVDLTKIH